MPHFNEKGVLIPASSPSGLPISRTKIASDKPRSWLPAIAGACVVVSVLLTGALVLWISWPSIQSNIRRVAQARDLENLQLIAKALNAYSDRYGTYPPPAVTDAAGKKLYSWRVLILPFMGHEDVYASFELAQPWDSPANISMLSKMPTEFASTNSPDALATYEANYALITGPGTLFPPTGPLSPKNIDAQTLLLVETNNSIAWTTPGDIDISRGLKVGNKSMVEIGGLHSGSFTAVTTKLDSLRIPAEVSQMLLDALVSPNGGEKVDTSAFRE